MKSLFRKKKVEIYQGWLMINKNYTDSTWNTFWCILTSSREIYFYTGPNIKKSKGKLSLRDCYLEQEPLSSQKSLSFTIIDHTSHSFNFIASSEQQKQEWKNHIQSLLTNIKQGQFPQPPAVPRTTSKFSLKRLTKTSTVSTSSSTLVNFEERVRVTSFVREREQDQQKNEQLTTKQEKDSDFKRSYSLGDFKVDCDSNLDRIPQFSLNSSFLLEESVGDLEENQDDLEKLQTTFPSLSVEVINAVLQANDGSLYETTKYLKMKGW
eukprot:TRINITY_DN7021_c0_g1_i1.p1 TRINITY_DN7021_c0_g1~~TRINITY_DN7021_c0_g1_i1.p1  ORF type:complete len:266 (+),score=63.30 TRINITY_DN7021_c0_g1_i1:72-869(+)